MKNKAICADEIKELIQFNPGISRVTLETHFDCSASRIYRAIIPVSNSGFLFKQMDKGCLKYYAAEYATANNVPEVIKAPPRQSGTYYRNRKKLREAAKAKKYGRLELHLLLNKLWPANRGLAAK